jgi:hypothetical protein
MFRARGGPKSSLALNDHLEHRSWGGPFVENSRISFLPNRPTNKHGKGGNGLPICVCLASHGAPPLLDGGVRRPFMCVYGGKSKPLFGQPPKSLCVPTMWEEVHHRFSSLQFVQPLLASRSAVQSLFWIANPTKNLTLDKNMKGTQFFLAGLLEEPNLH